MIQKICIEEALTYYGIEDEQYLDAIRIIQDNIIDGTGRRLFEDAWDALFGKECIQIERIEKLKNDLCGEKSPSNITGLLLLHAYSRHKKLSAYYCLSEADIEYGKWNLSHFTYRCWKDNRNNIAYETFLWLADFVNGNMFTCGSLIFQRYNKHLVHIHIPAKADISLPTVKDSISKATIELKKKYGMQEWITMCESWLLGPEIQELVKPESKIAKFSTLFDIRTGGDSSLVLFSCLYQSYVTSDIDALPENTSLQKAVKQKLADGVQFHEGIGTLKEGIL